MYKDLIHGHKDSLQLLVGVLRILSRNNQASLFWVIKKIYISVCFFFFNGYLHLLWHVARSVLAGGCGTYTNKIVVG